MYYHVNAVYTPIKVRTWSLILFLFFIAARAMGIANSARQVSLIRGERIYNSMKRDAKALIRDHKLKLRTHSNCFTGRYSMCVGADVCM